jgi:hypothetical protein
VKKLQSKGFGILPLLLLLVIVVLIVGTGFFVYRSQKDTNKSLDSTSKTLEELSKSDDSNTGAKEEDSWLLFTGEGYTVRVPDGWSGTSINGNLYVRDSSKMVYTKGTKATVESTEAGWDGGSPFALVNPGAYYTEIVRQGTESGTVKTDAGITAHKYIYVEANDPDVIGYAKGTKVYNYYFDADGKYIQVIHAISPGESDQSALVERVIKTIIIK